MVVFKILYLPQVLFCVIEGWVLLV